MHITKDQEQVLAALPGCIRQLVLRRSRFAREAVEEYGAWCAEIRGAIEERLNVLGVSGAHPDSELTWSALGNGRATALVAELEQCDEWDHAVSLALRLLGPEDQGDAR